MSSSSAGSHREVARWGRPVLLALGFFLCGSNQEEKEEGKCWQNKINTKVGTSTRKYFNLDFHDLTTGGSSEHDEFGRGRPTWRMASLQTQISSPATSGDPGQEFRWPSGVRHFPHSSRILIPRGRDLFREQLERGKIFSSSWRKDLSSAGTVELGDTPHRAYLGCGSNIRAEEWELKGLRVTLFLFSLLPHLPECQHPRGSLSPRSPSPLSPPREALGLGSWRRDLGKRVRGLARGAHTSKWFLSPSVDSCGFLSASCQNPLSSCLHDSSLDPVTVANLILGTSEEGSKRNRMSA